MSAKTWSRAGARTLAAVVLALSTAAGAQDAKFTYTERPKDDAKPGGWKAEVKGGLLWLTGNSNSLSVNAAARASYDAIWQKYTMFGDYTFARSTTLQAPTTTVTSLDQLQQINGLSARLWDLGFRFDQFVIHNNAQWETSLYALAVLGSDYAAGKKLTGDAQIGASTLLIKTGEHTLRGEGGFDFAFVDPYVDTTYFIFPGADLPMPNEGRVQIEQYRPHMREVSGYNVVYWKQKDMAYLMVSGQDKEECQRLYLKVRRAL